MSLSFEILRVLRADVSTPPIFEPIKSNFNSDSVNHKPYIYKFNQRTKITFFKH